MLLLQLDQGLAIVSCSLLNLLNKMRNEVASMD